MSEALSVERQSLESLVAEVADEFVERLKAGEQPDVEGYVARHPDCPPILRNVLESLRLMRSLAIAHATRQGVTGDSGNECLGDFQLLREIGRGGMGVVS